MAYTVRNFKTKKELKAAFAAGEKLEVYQPGGLSPLRPIGGSFPGDVVIEGPHYPEPHRWYAQVTVDENHVITKFVR